MCLFLNVSYYDMLLLVKLKNIIGNIKCLRKIYYSFIIILILQHYFRLGERQLWGSLNTPKSLMTLMTLTLMTGNDRSPMISEVSGRFPFRCQFLPLRNNHPVHLLDEILEIHKRVAEGFAPFQIFQRILQEVAGFYVAVHADVIQDVLQIDLLL